MPRFPCYFSLSMAMHVSVGWLLHDMREAASGVPNTPVPIMIQLVSPDPPPLPAPLPVKPAAAPAKPAQPARSQQVVPRPVVESKPRSEAARAVARAESATPRPSPPAKPRLIAATAASRSVERPSATSVPVVKPAVTEVFSHEPAFLTPPKPPIYPAQARRRNQQGLVLVEVRLDAHGLLREIKLLRSSGVESLDRSALDAVAAWRFIPETLNGQPVPSRVHIPIEFALSASR